MDPISPIELESSETIRQTPPSPEPVLHYDLDHSPTTVETQVDRARAPEASEFSAGQKVFERYTLKRIVGRGGMGVVWLADDEKLREQVALKFLPAAIRMDETAFNELLGETRSGRKLSHTNIVRIHDFVSDDRHAAISMEYIDGPTLAGVRAGHAGKVLEVAELAPLVQQLCDGLTYAHTKAKIIHHDLKPANLMVTPDQVLKITDFGIAKSLEASANRLTLPRAGGLSLAYASPQQVLGTPHAVGDDIYSMGATIYELLAGTPPFYTGDITRQVETVVPPPMAKRREESGLTGGAIPGHWEETIAACLAKDPARRPQSVEEVARRLKLAAEAPAGKAAKTAAPRVAKARRPFNVRKLVAACVILLVLAGAGVGGYFAWQEWQRREAIAAEQARVAETLRGVRDKFDAAEARAKAASALTEQRAALKEMQAQLDAMSPLVYGDATKPDFESRRQRYNQLVALADAAAEKRARTDRLKTEFHRASMQMDDRQKSMDDREKALKTMEAKLKELRQYAPPDDPDLKSFSALIEQSQKALTDLRNSFASVEQRRKEFDNWAGIAGNDSTSLQDRQDAIQRMNRILDGLPRNGGEYATLKNRLLGLQQRVDEAKSRESQAHPVPTVYEGTQIRLWKEAPVLSGDKPLRTGKQGETFTVLKHEGGRIYVSPDGKPSTLSVAENVVELVPLELKSVAGQARIACNRGDYLVAATGVGGAYVRGAHDARVKPLYDAIREASEASTAVQAADAALRNAGHENVAYRENAKDMTENAANLHPNTYDHQSAEAEKAYARKLVFEAAAKKKAATANLERAVAHLNQILSQME
jgi:hypothetical protein